MTPRSAYGTFRGMSVSVLNLRNVPTDVRQQFKSICAAKGATMTEVLKGVMTGVIEGEFEIDPETKMIFAGTKPPKRKKK